MIDDTAHPEKENPQIVFIEPDNSPSIIVLLTGFVIGIIVGCSIGVMIASHL